MLQLSEDALLQLAELGYSSKSSRRALRFSGGDVAAAVDFLTAQAEKKQVWAGALKAAALDFLPAQAQAHHGPTVARPWAQPLWQAAHTDGGTLCCTDEGFLGDLHCPC